MKKIFTTIRNTNGTALLVSLLIMGVLMSISLALSVLVFREIRVTIGALDAQKAYYAAESGIEEALYKLNTELPGWATNGVSKNLSYSNSSFQYVVKNTCKSFPCFPSDQYDTNQMPPQAFYGTLDLGASVDIPLFTVDESSGKVKSVKKFTVEFFAGFDPAQDLNVKLEGGGSVNSWDVLRWKIVGMREINDQFITEAINDFTAVVSGHTAAGTNFYTNADVPSWFGTDSCKNKSRRVTDKIKCEAYEFNARSKERTNGDGSTQESQLCTNTQARDYYVYDSARKEVTSINACYEIRDFMNEHQAGKNGATGVNYLTLTNMMNTNVFKNDVHNKNEKSRIYFRVETYDEELVREYADIVSDGYSGKSKQSIGASIKKDSYMPVFNFSIYSTYKKD